MEEIFIQFPVWGSWKELITGMIRFLAAAKNFNQLFVENALMKNVKNQYNWKQLYELHVLYLL